MDNRFGTLAQQARIMQAYPELRIMHTAFGDRLVYRGQMGQLMGGDRSASDIQAKWDSLEIYKSSK